MQKMHAIHLLQQILKLQFPSRMSAEIIYRDRPAAVFFSRDGPIDIAFQKILILNISFRCPGSMVMAFRRYFFPEVLLLYRHIRISQGLFCC